MKRPTARRLTAALQLIACRARFLAGEVVSPPLTARAAARLWFTPPPGRPAIPAPPGGTDFAIPFGTSSVVRGTTWGDGPAIYFMHGWGGSGLQIRSLIDPLVRCGFRVVSFDAPGHGSSTRRRTHAGEFATALTSVTAQHGRAHGIVAHSLGAVAVARAAVADGLRVDRLVLLAPLVDAGPMLDRFADLLRLGPRTRAQLPAETVGQTGLRIDQFTSRDLRRLVDGGSSLIVHDRHDSFTPFADAADLSRGWPGSTLVPTEGLGHQRLLHDPTVTATVVRFLTQQPPPSLTEQELSPTVLDQVLNPSALIGDS